MRNDLKILESTLRDGSYAIDYQFTAEDTAILAAGLEDAGFRYIEIGHGLGLNASNAGEGISAASDEDYLAAAASVLKKAKFGMFFIPEIGRMEDLRMATDYGMGFVRIGTNAPEVAKAEKYIKYAKKLDLIVSSNLMKSYALPPREFARNAQIVEEWGADIVYIVDSAGGMLPKDIENYAGAIISRTKEIEIGFHAHNNLSLAVANTITAIENGISIVDSCLQGIGRSAGNTQTEILVLVLEKMGYRLDIDPLKVMNLGQKIVNPMLHKTGIDPIEITSGYALFHSKFLEYVLNNAVRFNVDPRELIIETSKRNLVNVSDELVANVAEQIKKKGVKERKTKKLFIKRLSADIKGELDTKRKASEIASELLSLSKKTGKNSIFTISTSKNGKEVIFPFIRENMVSVVGNCEVNSYIQLKEVVEAVDGKVDIILVDADKKIEGKHITGLIGGLARKSTIMNYLDADARAVAIDAIISKLIGDIMNARITIISCTALSIKLAQRFLRRGSGIMIWDENEEILEKMVNGLTTISESNEIFYQTDAIKAAENADVIISFNHNVPGVSKEIIDVMRPDGLLFDAGIGTIDPECIQYALDSGKTVFRLDMRAGLSGEIVTLLETKDLLEKIAGTTTIDGVKVVAGGFIGKKGDIVVNSVSNPSKIIGVANGAGDIIRDSKDLMKYNKKIEKVRLGIAEKMLEF